MNTEEMNRRLDLHKRWVDRSTEQQAEDESEPPECVACFETYRLGHDAEPSAFCDSCAQELLPWLIEEVERLRLGLAEAEEALLESQNERDRLSDKYEPVRGPRKHG